MNYEETIEYLYNLLPVFHREGGKAYKASLDNINLLCSFLNNPQNNYKSIHIAGTNGKGSSSHLLAAILQQSGYKVGLYTSPHLKDYVERFRINGKSVDKAKIVSFVDTYKDIIEQIKPSFFELSVAFAFNYFSEEKVDIAVIEVGLGGRLDSTNIITPIVSLITNIGFDHMDILGDTLPKIAFEKAGIIKENIPVVISEKCLETKDVFLERAKLMNSRIYFADEIFRIENSIDDTFNIFKFENSKFNEYLFNTTCGLKGIYQQKNIKGVLTVIEILKNLDYNISMQAIKDGIENVVELTCLKGRWQKLGEYPLVICDTGHNEHGIKILIEEFRKIPAKKKIFILGFVRDKDVSKILSMFPKDGIFYFCESDNPRFLSSENLLKLAESMGYQGYSILSVNDALKEAKKIAENDDFIFIGGSTYIVAELDNL